MVYYPVTDCKLPLNVLSVFMNDYSFIVFESLLLI